MSGIRLNGMKDMVTDGVAAEVLYPSLGLGLFCLQDAAFQEALFRTYNDWVIDYCQKVPDRLFRRRADFHVRCRSRDCRNGALQRTGDRRHDDLASAACRGCRLHPIITNVFGRLPGSRITGSPAHPDRFWRQHEPPRPATVSSAIVSACNRPVKSKTLCST